MVAASPRESALDDASNFFERVIHRQSRQRPIEPLPRGIRKIGQQESFPYPFGKLLPP